jgi:hypothetical protein
MKHHHRQGQLEKGEIDVTVGERKKVLMTAQFSGQNASSSKTSSIAVHCLISNGIPVGIQVHSGAIASDERP